ncbi:hypothetical protein KM043_011467 [Ampulex compressa]|nr:hypothetical protein KM043_011467 [Ampulex compressa]
MFETENWTFDQDFLNDVDEKALKFYSQADQIDVPTKKRKIEVSNDLFDNNKFSNNTKNVTNIKERATKTSPDKVLRKNMILEMLNTNLLEKNDDSKISDKAKSNENNSSELNDNLYKSTGIHSSRKNVVLNILQKKNLHNLGTEDKQTTSINSNNICVKDRNGDSSTNINADLRQNNNRRLIPIKKKTELSQIRVLNEDKFPNKNDSVVESLAFQVHNKVLEKTQNSDKQNILDNHSPCSSTNNNITANCGKPSSSVAQFQPPRPNKKTALVRQFPGPAGLIPDNIDGAVSPVSYINNYESENNRIEKTIHSSLSMFCSQNMESLFTEGAWQSMVDDLPVGFLNGYEISTIKQIANTNNFQSTKIEILAGVIESVDYSSENPPIVLKDFTDSIQGIIHSDISLKYSGIIKPNVVLLLHNVGLLRISGVWTASKYLTLIFPASLLCIYSSKSKTLCSPEMQSIVKSVFNEKSKSMNYCPLVPALKNPAHSKSSMVITNEKKINHELEDVRKRGNPSKKEQQGLATDTFKAFEDISQLMNFDDEDDFAISSAEVTNLTNTKNFMKPPSNSDDTKNQMASKPTNIVDQKSSNCNKRRGYLLETLKKFSANSKSKKIPHASSTTIFPMSSSSNSNLITDSAHVNNVTDSNVNSLSSRLFQPSGSSEEFSVTSSSIDNDSEIQDPRYSSNTKKPNDQSVKSKLLQYKNNNTKTTVSSLTNASKMNSDMNDRSETVSRAGTFQNILLESENDSDDEILSQLDIDTIFGDYDQDS